MAALKVDVAIVGAGPGGAAAANSIRKAAPQLNVQVYERAKQLRRVGFCIGLATNGLSAITAIGADCRSKVDSILLPDGEIGRYNAKGEEFSRAKPVKTDGAQPLGTLVPWFRLQQELLELLPEGTVHLNHTLQDITISPSNGVTLEFVDQPRVQATIVVGCDGNQSAVRQALLADGRPNYAGKAVWRGQTRVPEAWPYGGDRSSWFIDFATGTGIHAYSMGDGYLGWTIVAAWPEEDVDVLGTKGNVQTEGGPPADGKLARCLASVGNTAGWPEVVLEAIAGTDESTVVEHGMFYRTVDQCTVWGRGPVSLLGDAAHVISPFLGQGLNQALEDAAELGRAIGEHGATEAALRQYESVRQPRARRVQEGSNGVLMDYIDGRRVDERAWHIANPWVTGYKVAPVVAPQPGEAAVA